MKTVDLFDANRLSEIIDSREVVTITKHGHPAATSSPIRENAAAVAARIRVDPCTQATAEEMVRMVRDGRR